MPVLNFLRYLLLRDKPEINQVSVRLLHLRLRLILLCIYLLVNLDISCHVIHYLLF